MNSRILGIALAVTSAVVLTLSLLGDHWLRAHYDTGEVNLGLRNVKVCADDHCVTEPVASCQETAAKASEAEDMQEYTWALLEAPAHCSVLIGGSVFAAMFRQAKLSRNDKDLERRLDKVRDIDMGSFLMFARATFYIGWAVVGLLLICASLAAANKFVYGPVAPTTLALFALIGLFIAGPVTVALNPFVGLGVDWGFWLFGGGATVGVIAGIALGRLKPPDDPYWDGLDEPGDQIGESIGESDEEGRA